MRVSGLKIAYLSLIIFTAGVSNAQAWTEPVKISLPELGLLDPRAVAVGETLHVVATGGSLNFYYLKSNDNGRTWSQPVIIADTLENSETPDIVYSNGKVHIAFVGYYVPTTIYHMSSSDGGENWSNLHQVFNTAPLWLAYPRLAANGDTLFLTCAMENRILSFRSFDDGVTWQDSTVVDSGLLAILWHQTLVFASGKLYLVEELWTADDSITYEIYCCTSSDYGLSWSERIPLSTVERYPQRRFASTQPAAFANSLGDILVAWKDYKYGHMCGFSGEILARISVDNGETWQAESRLTRTQSGETPHGLFSDTTMYVATEDSYPMGCIYPKITLIKSTDWGNSWTLPELISGNRQSSEDMPFFFQNIVSRDTIFHCLFIRDESGPWNLYYTRSSDFVSINEGREEIQPVGFNLHAYPNPFNSSTLITFANREGDDLKAEIFNPLGQRIWTKSINGKEGQIIWDATDIFGRRSSAGTYYLRLKNNRHSETLKLLFLK